MVLIYEFSFLEAKIYLVLIDFIFPLPCTLHDVLGSMKAPRYGIY